MCVQTAAVSRAIATPRVKSLSNGVAVSCDGSTLLVSDCDGGSHAVHEFGVASATPLRVVGKRGWFGGRGSGDGPLQFNGPRQVWVASDGYVFVAELGNNRVQVLTPGLDFHDFIGVGHLDSPSGVCASADVVVVSDLSARRLSVFQRTGGSRLRRFGVEGRGDGQLISPLGLCFMPGNRHVAVADYGNHRVSVFSVDGEFVRHVGVGSLMHPWGVACSATGELVVADTGHRRIAVFASSGELLRTLGDGDFKGVTIHGSTIFAVDCDSTSKACVVLN